MTAVGVPLDSRKASRHSGAMKKPRLPGLPTVSALMLTAIIATALGLFGPIDIAKFKEWQTLFAAFIAPSIALIAAIVAYKGAMAQVNQARSVYEETIAREQNATRLRLKLATATFSVDLKMRERLLEAALANAIRTDPKPDFDVSAPPEFDEAWKNLQHLDGGSAQLLATLRVHYREYRELVQTVAQEGTSAGGMLMLSPAYKALNKTLGLLLAESRDLNSRL
jgi:hypothetical protein